MAQEEYPKHILPSVGWRKGITGSDILNTAPDASIGRRIDGDTKKCIDDSLGEDAIKLTIAALPNHSIPNLSTNLLGCRFEMEDFVFNTQNDGKEDWEEGKDVSDLILVKDNYRKVVDEYFVVGWMVKNVDGLPIPYKRVFLQKEAYDNFKQKFESQQIEKDGIVAVYLDEYEKLTIDSNKQKSVIAKGAVKLNHVPTNLNYWHFTIDLYPMEDAQNPIEDNKKSWKKLMAENVGDYLRRSFLLIPKDLQPQKINNWEQMVIKK